MIKRILWKKPPPQIKKKLGAIQGELRVIKRDSKEILDDMFTLQMYLCFITLMICVKK